MWDIILHILPLGILLGIGFYMAGWTIIKDLLFPDQKGTVLRLPDLSQQGCEGYCASRKGYSTLLLQVQLDNKEVIQAEVSPCSLCLDRLKPGDRVGINRVGERIIAKRAPLWNIEKC